MDLLHSFSSAPIWGFTVAYIIPFLVVLSVLVFVHEWGHYIVARINGIKVEQFSIGFGRKIIGWTDKAGTQWKIGWLPVGGYVQMFGDSDPTSSVHEGDAARKFSAAEKKVAFYTQSVGKRAAVVFAGPAINFIFAILVMAILFAVQGQPYTPAIVGKLVDGSPAQKAGIKPDDKIIQLNDVKVAAFEDIVEFVSLNMDKPIKVKLLHYKGNKTWSKKPVSVKVKPEIVGQVDRFGFKSQRGRLGIIAVADTFDIKKHNPASAFIAANVEVVKICKNTLRALGQIITGSRSTDELGGILRIGAYAGDFAKEGALSLIMFMALLSVNLGLINLLPIPLLDGGHLAFFAVEAVRGKPITERVQEYALRGGMAFVISIMLLATWNDLVQLNIITYFKNLFS